MSEPLLVVLDLDETLIHASDNGLVDSREPDFHVGMYPVYKRPHVDEFLRGLFTEFRVAVWTSASPAYADQVVDNLFGDDFKGRLEFVWDSKRCTQKYHPEKLEFYWLKNLKKVKRQGFKLDKVVAVDDSPEKYSANYGNLVQVSAYEGAVKDNCLPYLLEYLCWLKNESDVRKVDKRGWRVRYEQRV